MRLPAYARGLIARRHAGVHPFAVYFLFHDDWTLRAMPFAMPFLAISPNAWAPGRFDLRCVAGVDVYLEARADRWTALAGELAREARHVWWRLDVPVYRGDRVAREQWESLDTLALSVWLTDHVWPEWWSAAGERRAA